MNLEWYNTNFHDFTKNGGHCIIIIVQFLTPYNFQELLCLSAISIFIQISLRIHCCSLVLSLHYFISDFPILKEDVDIHHQIVISRGDITAWALFSVIPPVTSIRDLRKHVYNREERK